MDCFIYVHMYMYHTWEIRRSTAGSLVQQQAAAAAARGVHGGGHTKILAERSTGTTAAAVLLLNIHIIQGKNSSRVCGIDQTSSAYIYTSIIQVAVCVLCAAAAAA